MGKRMRGQSLSSAESILRLRLISSNLAGSSLIADGVAAHLRSAFREYSRLPRNIFANNVERILASLRQQRNDDDEFEERKSARKSGGDSMSNYSSTSTSVSVDNDDVASNAKTEPKCDLMKSMLRDNYVEKNKPAWKPAPEVENNMEIQTGGKDGRKLDNDEVLRNIEAAVTSNGLPTFDDLGGINELLEQLEHKVLAPLCHPKLLERVGMRPMDGILLHGPPGCGKTKLARAIANEAGVPFYQISAAEVVSGVTGASEENIRDLFKKAHMTAPSIIFINEIDAIASKRENMQKEMEKRIVTQLLTCMDEYHQTHQSNNNNDLEGESSETKPMPVLVIGATNRLNALDQALRRPGRFGREIALGVPDENGRIEILSVRIKRQN